MQAIGRQPRRAPDGATIHQERRGPPRSSQRFTAWCSSFQQAEAEAGADLPQFVKAEFGAFLECGILAACGQGERAMTLAARPGADAQAAPAAPLEALAAWPGPPAADQVPGSYQDQANV